VMTAVAPELVTLTIALSVVSVKFSDVPIKSALESNCKLLVNAVASTCFPLLMTHAGKVP
jgi:hypothetical protein